jgi:hypothetical protein
VCRCVPFIHRTMKLEELVSAREIRSIIKDKFKAYKDVTDPRVRWRAQQQGASVCGVCVRGCDWVAQRQWSAGQPPARPLCCIATHTLNTTSLLRLLPADHAGGGPAHLQGA